jgi:hypothetical protein
MRVLKSFAVSVTLARSCSAVLVRSARVRSDSLLSSARDGSLLLFMALSFQRRRLQYQACARPVGSRLACAQFYLLVVHLARRPLGLFDDHTGRRGSTANEGLRQGTPEFVKISGCVTAAAQRLGLRHPRLCNLTHQEWDGIAGDLGMVVAPRLSLLARFYTPMSLYRGFFFDGRCMSGAPLLTAATHLQLPESGSRASARRVYRRPRSPQAKRNFSDRPLLGQRGCNRFHEVGRCA